MSRIFILTVVLLVALWTSAPSRAQGSNSTSSGPPSSGPPTSGAPSESANLTGKVADAGAAASSNVTSSAAAGGVAVSSGSSGSSSSSGSPAGASGSTTIHPSSTLKPTKTTTTPKPVVYNCPNQNFEAMLECCLSGVPFDLFPRPARTACYLTGAEVGASRIVSRAYVLPRWQVTVNTTAGKRDALVLEDKKRQNLIDMKCHSVCLFKNQSLFDGKSINFEAAANFFKNSVPAESAGLMSAAAANCSQSVQNVTSLWTTADASSRCPAAPFAYLQCLWRQILLSCPMPPPPQKPTRETAGSFAQMCTNRRKVLAFCDPFKTE